MSAKTHVVASSAPVAPSESATTPLQPRSRLFRKYALLFVALVVSALLTSGALELWFSYQEHKAALASVQKEKALAAAARIEQFIDEITRQIGWTARAQRSIQTLEQRRDEYHRLLLQAPAVTELSHIDSTGREELRISRLAMDVIGSGIDFSTEPKFREAKTHKIWFSQVYFRRESEPYMTVAITGIGRDASVTVAEVNLTFIWDVISRIKVGQAGYAYVVDSHKLLIAHSDITLVLRKTDLSHLPQVTAALTASTEPQSGETPLVGADFKGRPVVTAHAQARPVDWTVFVDLPLSEAFVPLYESLVRTTGLILLGLCLSVFAALVVARRMVVPIEALRAGAAEIGGGDLGRRIIVKTDDELEALAEQFNDMAGQLQQSYADLEGKVEARTRELARLVDEMKALGEVSQVVNSTLDLETVLTTIVARAVELSGTDAGAIYVRDTGDDDLRFRATYGMDEELVKALSDSGSGGPQTLIGRAVASREVVEIADLTAHPNYPLYKVMERANFKALLAVPLLRDNEAVGALVVRRKTLGTFDRNTVELLQTMGTQSALAIYNARLFGEIETQAAELLGWNRALDAEFEKGKQIQKEFLPHELPCPTGWDIAAWFHAARQVSGDFYDAFLLQNGCLAVVIGDVCDKGIGSALFMALIRSLIRVFTGKISLSGGCISAGDPLTMEAMDVEVGTALGAVTLTSEYIAREHGEQGMFATLCMGIINPKTGELAYVNAGHLPLLIIGKSGVRASLNVTGPSVGIAPGLKFRGAMARIEPDEMLCGYTDGVTEAMSPNEMLYTKERFFALLENPASSAPELIEQVKADLFSHVKNASQSDDITMIAVHRQLPVE